MTDAERECRSEATEGGMSRTSDIGTGLSLHYVGGCQLCHMVTNDTHSTEKRYAVKHLREAGWAKVEGKWYCHLHAKLKRDWAREERRKNKLVECERCGQPVKLSDRGFLAAEGRDWEACPSCLEAYDRQEQRRIRRDQ